MRYPTRLVFISISCWSRSHFWLRRFPVLLIKCSHVLEKSGCWSTPIQLLVIPLRMLEFTANSSSEKRLLAKCCVAAMVLLWLFSMQITSSGHKWPPAAMVWIMVNSPQSMAIPKRVPGGAVPRPLSASTSLAARGAAKSWPCDLQRSRTSGGQQGEGDGAVQALPGPNCPKMGRGMEDDGGGLAWIYAKKRAKYGEHECLCEVWSKMMEWTFEFLWLMVAAL